MGVQIQGEQFRILAERFVGNKTEEVFDEFLKYGWFDQEVIKEGKNKYIKGRRTRMTPRDNRSYNQYRTSRSSFVYQYFDLDEETKNYDVLYKMIIKYMTKAKEILANNDYLMKNL